MKNWQKIKQHPQSLEKFLIREKVIDVIRDFFKKQDFHEVETPHLVKSPGTEPHLDVFATNLKLGESKSEPAYLLTSPEYAMKKLLVAGLPKIFQICKSFRNGESLTSSHNPEFTILEWYRADADYEDIMTDCENLLVELVKRVKGTDSLKLVYQGKEHDLTPPWPRMSVAETFRKWVGVSVDQLLSEAELKKVAKKKGYQVSGETTWEEVYHQLFLNLIEPELARMKTPVIVYDYPTPQAALSKKKQSDPRFAERFEFYLAGLELGNAFSELTDPTEQKSRLVSELTERKKLGKTRYVLDKDFINALQAGMPESGGIAVGVDRLVMLMADTADIQETLFFPAGEMFG